MEHIPNTTDFDEHLFNPRFEKPNNNLEFYEKSIYFPKKQLFNKLSKDRKIRKTDCEQSRVKSFIHFLRISRLRSESRRCASYVESASESEDDSSLCQSYVKSDITKRKLRNLTLSSANGREEDAVFAITECSATLGRPMIDLENDLIISCNSEISNECCEHSTEGNLECERSVSNSGLQFKSCDQLKTFVKNSIESFARSEILVSSYF